MWKTNEVIILDQDPSSFNGYQAKAGDMAVLGIICRALIAKKIREGQVGRRSGNAVGIREEKETTIPMDVNPKRLQSDEERSLQ